jgi:hypothetical protein
MLVGKAVGKRSLGKREGMADNPLKPSGKYIYIYIIRALTISNSAFCICGFRITLKITAIISLNNINQLIFVM